MIDTELSKKNLFERTNKNNKTIIIDNFISKDNFLSIKNSSLEKLNGGNSPDYVWYYLDEEHDFSELCIYLINCVSNYYDLTSCVGYEFWTQNNTRPKGWHYDKDEQLKNNVGKFRFPICSIVYYINVQNLIGGRLHLHEDIITPKENRLIIFPPATYHFVEDFDGERTSLLVNPWSKRVHEQQMPTYPKWRKQ